MTAREKEQMPDKPKKQRTLRLVEERALDPLTAWRSYKTNTLLWARWWLENGGALPASCHFIIREHLAPSITAVTARPELRDELLAVVPQIPVREPPSTRNWIMPAVGKSYSTERDLDAMEQEGASPAAEPLLAPQKGRSGDRGGVTSVPADVRHPPPPVTPQEGVLAFPLPEGTRACKVCGKPFRPYRANAASCSSRCRKWASRGGKRAA
jgi:hypothetical protein